MHRERGHISTNVSGGASERNAVGLGNLRRDAVQREVELYGIYPGLYICPLRGNTVSSFMIYAPFSPTRYVLDALRGLPKGSNVGLGTFNPKHNMPEAITVSDAIVNHIAYNAYSEASSTYWKKLNEQCLDLGFKVTYLEHPDTYTSIWKLSHEKDRLMEELKNANGDKDASRIIYEKIYVNETNTAHLYRIERSMKILENIRQHNPDIVVLDITQANLLWGSALDGRVLGMKFSYYAELEPDIKTIRDVIRMHMFDDSLKQARIHIANRLNECVEPPLPVSVYGKPAGYKKDMIEIVSVWRRRYVLTNGRITLGKPSFLGIDSLEMPQSRLFELYIERSMARDDGGYDVNGRIEDVYGRSIFSGRLADDALDIKRRYVEDASIPSRLDGPVYYNCKRTRNDVFEGTFSSQESEGKVSMRDLRRE